MKTRTIISIGFGIIITALIVNAYFSYRAVQMLIAKTQRATASANFLKELEVTLSYIIGAETGARGYIITGDQTYLQPYDKALNQLDLHREALKNLAVVSPSQATHIPKLEKLILDKRRLMSEVILQRSLNFQEIDKCLQ